jgi:hypothetical protein
MIRRFDVPTLHETRWRKKGIANEFFAVALRTQKAVDLHVIKELFHLRPSREVLVQVEKVLKLKLLHRYGFLLANGQTRVLKRLLHASPVVLVRRKQLQDASAKEYRESLARGTTRDKFQ